MNRIDRRRNYIMMMDTETANCFTEEDGKLNMMNALVYDIGWAVIDKHGNTYETKSYIVKEIFFDEPYLMKSAYYADKIFQYLVDIAEGRRIVASWWEIRRDFHETMERYRSTITCAHNARFDYRAVNNTQRWLTKSKYRYFFPKNTTMWDTLKMSRDVVAKTPSYIHFCEKHEFLTKAGKPKLTAEVLYRFISNDPAFIESHTGLEDVNIEKKILAYCFRKKKKMRKNLFND